MLQTHGRAGGQAFEGLQHCCLVPEGGCCDGRGGGLVETRSSCSWELMLWAREAFKLHMLLRALQAGGRLLDWVGGWVGTFAAQPRPLAAVQGSVSPPFAQSLLRRDTPKCMVLKTFAGRRPLALALAIVAIVYMQLSQSLYCASTLRFCVHGGSAWGAAAWSRTAGPAQHFAGRGRLQSCLRLTNY